MQIKTSELDGEALHYIVAKIEGWLECPGKNWVLYGRIIEREGINLTSHSDGWTASKDFKYYETGKDLLTAAMRCHVASKLGNSVEVSNKLE